MANSIFMSFNGFADQGGGSVSTPGSITAGSAATGSFYANDGTSALPSYSFTAEPTLGFWRSGAATTTHQGALSVTGNLGSTGTINTAGSGALFWATRALLRSPANGILTLNLFNETIGAELKVDALPTVSSGFGTSPAITAGSTPLSGSVNVGTGGAATSGVINFNGTAFPSAPFVVATSSLTNAVIRATATATQLTITCTTAFTASDVISWLAISSK